LAGVKRERVSAKRKGQETRRNRLLLNRGKKGILPVFLPGKRHKDGERLPFLFAWGGDENVPIIVGEGQRAVAFAGGGEKEGEEEGEGENEHLKVVDDLKRGENHLPFKRNRHAETIAKLVEIQKKGEARMKRTLKKKDDNAEVTGRGGSELTAKKERQKKRGGGSGKKG